MLYFEKEHSPDPTKICNENNIFSVIAMLGNYELKTIVRHIVEELDWLFGK